MKSGIEKWNPVSTVAKGMADDRQKEISLLSSRGLEGRMRNWNRRKDKNGKD